MLTLVLLFHVVVSSSLFFFFNTHQFLSLKGPNLIGEDPHEKPALNGRVVDCVEHMDKFWLYLKKKGITAHRSAIVKAVAEKAGGFFYGLYDENAFADDEE